MKRAPGTELTMALAWAASALGPVETMVDRTKVHGGHESSTCRLRSAGGFCYLKVHHTPSHWHQEVYAYEHWACVFGEQAPRLLTVRDEAPLALVVTELPGQIMEHAQLLPAQQKAAWQAAGQALAGLHRLGPGEHFGPCLRDGTFTEPSARAATEHVTRRFGNQIERAIEGQYISLDELATLRAAHDLVPAFAGERPVPCHRDYSPANWLVDEQGRWTGVIDFEFAHWDVRVADFSRDPDWSWIRRPDLCDAFLEGYGRPHSPSEQQQLLVAYAEYALDAILWGRGHAFYGFEQEGRDALAHLAGLLR